MGNSVLEIAKNIILKPQIILSYLFNLVNLEYLLLLFIPVIWGISWQHLTNLIPAIPTLFLNLLTDYQPQKDLIHQYSLPIVPFLILTVIASLAAGHSWLKTNRNIIIWSIVAFLALAKFGYFSSKYLTYLDTWKATREALTKIDADGSVITSAYMAPHLTHRSIVELAVEGPHSKDITQFDYILLNLRHPGWNSTPEIVNNLLNQAQQNPQFQIVYQKDDIFLFQKLTNK